MVLLRLDEGRKACTHQHQAAGCLTTDMGLFRVTIILRHMATPSATRLQVGTNIVAMLHIGIVDG